MKHLNLNHNFLRVALLVLLATFSITNAWAGHGGACTAELKVNKGTGSGSVYAATTSSATSGNASVSAGCGNSDNGTHTHTFYAFATPADGYTFLGWTESATSTAGADASNPKAVTITSNNHGTVTNTLYAHFVEKAKVNITFEAPSNGTYTIAVNGGSAETVSSADVVKNNVEGVELTATPASGYAFAGWYKLNSAGEFVEDLSIASPYDASFTTSETIKMGARFVPTTLGKFILKGSETQYYGLKAATVAAGGSGTIVPVADETLVDGSDLMPFDNGTYNIKAGTTLLIPYSSANTVQTAPQIITTAATLSAYKTLVFTDGVNVECDGTICVGGQIMAAGGGKLSSYVSGPCGMINMANGGHIELNRGAKLYCWGFIKGQDMDQGNNTVGVGTITANSGAEVWENLGIGDWRGGTATSNIKNTRFFPFQSYFIQNIEVPLTIEYGASEKNYIALNATGGPYNTSATTIGNSKALFLLKDANSAFRKWYDPTTDLTCFELSGTSQIDELSITIDATLLSIDVRSSDFDLPINSSMHIILTNSSVTLSKPMVLQPGAVIEVKNDANITLSSNAYLYDKDNWGAYAGPDYYFHSYPNLTSHKNRGNGKSNDLLDDAKVIVDGTVSVTGKLYSTASGANVMGNGGGEIVFPSSLPTATTIPAFTGNGDAVSGGVAVNSANLCNEDESYTKAIASTTFYNVNGRWFKSGNQNENADHTYNFTYIASGAVSGTGGTDVSPNTHNAVYAPDKTGLTAGMKWCNVEQDATCSNIFNAIQALNETPASNIRYTYPLDSWLQLLKTETEGIYGGSDNSLYAVEGCAVNSLGSMDENCLYTIDAVKKALVDGHFVALEKNTEDEAWHDVANPTNYYISFAGCTWHPATKEVEEKAYTVEDGIYIWYSGDWKLVEREDPFFFDYNDQNVKRYYEYEDGAWVLASPRVRVVDAIETRDFYKLPEAITVASGKKNTTITILKDISGINAEMTYTAKNTTCTFDLNGKTVRGSAATLLEINASGTTFTITDNSDEKTGKLENIFAQNAVTYGIKLTAGTLSFEHGIIHAENPAQYHSSSLKSCGARGIHVAATNTLNISGGRVEAKATRAAYAVLEASSAANNTTVNITGGELYAEAPYTAYGVYAYGKLNVSGDNTITVKINTDMVDAAYAATNANNTYNGDGRGIYLATSANKAQASCYFSTLTYTGGTINVTNERVLNKDYRAYGIFFDCGNATTDNRGGATDGSSGQKTAAKGSVKNANITVTSGTQYSIGIYVTGSYNSYDKSTHVVKIENCNIDVKGYANNFGIWANAGVNSTNGGCYHGDVQADNCTVTVESTGSSYAYGAWASAAATTIAQYKNPTTESESTVASKYYGEYASAAKLTINGGSYTAKTKTVGAYAVGTTAPRAISPYGSKYSDAAFRTEGGHAKDSATLIINGGTFNATSTTYAARGLSSGGNTTINDATFTVVAGSYQAYGLYALSGKITATNVHVNDTAKGRVSSSDSNGYAYGAFADCAVPAGNTAQNGFGYAGEMELNNCTFNVATTTYPTARGIMVNATSKLHNWTTFQADSLSNKWTTANYNYYKQVFPCTIQGKDSVWVGVAAKATVNNCDFTVKAQTTSAFGAYVSRALHYSYQTPNTILEQLPGELNINGTSFDVSTGTSTTAEGIRTYGTVNISGNTNFNVHPATSTAIGLRIYAGTTTVNDNPTFDITAATSSAYGAWVFADTPADKTGATYNGELVVNGGTFNVTTSTTTAYGVYVQAATRQITSTAAGYYPGTYASIGHATINDGTFNVTAGTTTASGVYVGRAVTADNLQIFRGVADINGGTFTVKALKQTSNAACDGVRTYGTTTITDGVFDVQASNSATAKNALSAWGVCIYDGTTTIGTPSDATKPEFTVKAYGTAYGVHVTADQPNATTGLASNSNLTIEGGKFSVSAMDTITAYGVLVSGIAPRVIASGDHAGTYYSTTQATINDGTFDVYAKQATAIGVFIGRSYTSANTHPNTFSNFNYAEGTINGGKFTTSATTSSITVYADGHLVVNGGEFEATGRTSDAYGLYARAGVVTVNGTNNPTFTVRAPKTVYGAMIGAQPASKTGLPYNGELTVNGGYFDVQTTSGATAYGVYVNANKRQVTSTSSGNYRGNYVSAGTAIINDGTFYVKAVGKTASGINMVAAVSYAAGEAPFEAVSATPTCTVNGGKFKVFASSSASAVVSTPSAANMPISGGYYNINTNLSKYAVSPKKVLTLRESHALYPEDYRYTVNEGGTVTWMNGSVELGKEVYEIDEIPTYKGETPTKTETAQYTYTHSGWDPTIVAMENSDVTYSATFTPTLRQYDVTFNLQGHGASIAKQTLDYGSLVSKPANPSATDYTFEGWYKEAACTNPWNFETDIVIGATELFAKWVSDNEGEKLDIVEWTSNGDGTGTLTLNLNGIPAAGWPYTINGTEYNKEQRAADRTLTIPYSGSADSKLTITVKDKDDNTYSRYKYIIPHVYGETAELAATNSPARVIVVNSGTLTVVGNVTVDAIYVRPEAELVVNSGVTLTTDNLYLRTTPWKAASLTNNGTITATNTYYTRIIADNSKYFQFAIPLASDVKNVRLSNNSKCTYNSSWMLKSYSENARANNGAVNTEAISNWALLDGVEHTTVEGSVGYEMFSNTPYYREYYFPVTLPASEATEVGVSRTSDGAAGPKHAGWNALCSPLMRKYPQTHGEPDERLKISLLNPDGSYLQTAPDIIYPAVPFYYQASKNGKIYFNSSTMVFNTPRRAWNTYIPTQWLQLAIRNIKGDKLDETSIYAHPEKFAPEYETGYDVAKQSLEGGKALLYTELPCGKLAFAAVPDSLAEQRLPLTVYAAAQEEYVFSLAENNYLGRLQHVLLHDTQTGLVTDLLERDCAVNLEQGTNAGRFYIQCVFNAEAPEISTGVNHLNTENDKAQKIIYNDKVYIIYQGRVYDMTGRQCELK